MNNIYRSGNNNIIIICNCESIEHQVQITYDERHDEFLMTFHLQYRENIFHRIWVAIKYILGHRSKYGEWDEIVFNTSMARMIAEFLLPSVTNNLDSDKKWIG